MLHSSEPGISVDYAPAMQALQCIESDSHSSVNKMFVLGIINSMMNIKRLGLTVVICIEINADLQ